jgi:hypothetical protein
MRKTIFSLAMLFFAALSNNANAQSSVTATANAEVVTPIAITQVQGLHFGTISATGTAGTVTVAPAGTHTESAGVKMIDFTLGKQGTYTVTGTGTATYAITDPVSTTITNGTVTMTIDTFSFDSANAAPGFTGTLAAGTDTLSAGAVLHVGANQASGAYAGTFNLTVNYN